MSDEKAYHSEIEGKKVFFLYPTVSVQNQVVAELVQSEYEIYVSRNHGKLAAVLKKYTDSIVYINLDEGMKEGEWGKWIKALKTALPEIQIGIFTGNSTEELQEKYIKDIKVSCGFFSLKLDMSKTITQIADIFEKLNVKGRRKYIRAATDSETTATINIPHGGNIINGNILDISVVGISCVFGNDPGLREKSLIKDMQIRLKTILIKAEAIMIGSRKNDDNDNIYVLLFTNRLDPDAKIKIRKYIQQNMQSKMDKEIN